ncbi:MAG: basic amino acid/polyamine antiporter [Rhodocyclaceae bacterium]
MSAHAEKKLGLPALTAMVVGSIIGAGIFSLPRTFGSSTGALGALLAWLVAGTGMYALAHVFQSLARRKPDLDAGVFAYAKAGFGDYLGFLSAFGYWIGTCIGNVSYWVLIKSTLGAFFPVFGEGNTAIAILAASAGIWLFHFMILRGIQQAAFINSVVTLAKVVPIVAFILIALFAFRLDVFRANLWGGEVVAGLSLFEQVRLTMLVTVFVFLGIEGASVYSRHAKKRAHVGVATLLGFVAALCLMVLVSLLPYGVLPQGEIAGLRQPSMAGVLSAIVGPWGAVFVSIGLLISVLGAYLAWSLICAEVLFAAARNGDMPAVFARENANKVPAAALWLTNIVVQCFVISTYWSSDAFSLMLSLTSSMSLIPYLLVAGFGVLVAQRRLAPFGNEGERRRELAVAAVAALYTAFMVYAGGIGYLLLSALLYAPGTFLYAWARREQGQRLFTHTERIVFAVAVMLAIAAVVGLVRGSITL